MRIRHALYVAAAVAMMSACLDAVEEIPDGGGVGGGTAATAGGGTSGGGTGGGVVGGGTGGAGGSGGGGQAAGGGGGSACNASLFNGVWRRSDGFQWTITSTGCVITGTGDSGPWSHLFTSTITSASLAAVVTVRRTNNVTGCVTLMFGSFLLVDASHFTMAFTSSDGHCDLDTTFNSAAVYVKQ